MIKSVSCMSQLKAGCQPSPPRYVNVMHLLAASPRPSTPVTESATLPETPQSQSALSGALIVSGSQVAKAFAILPRPRASSLDSLFLKHHPGIDSYSVISTSKHRVEVELFYVGVLLHKVGDF